MPNWNGVLKELQECERKDALDYTRKKYLKKLYDTENRNVISYYSGFLQFPGIEQTGINDNDKNAFMNAINQLDKSKGLDLILHTPGGGIAEAESIVNYLKSIFGNDIRAIVPQIAMSAGTMIALSCKAILMGKESNLGPIDPQFGGLSASGVIDEFNRAYEEIKADQLKLAVWQPILSKYHPTFIGDCENAIKWSNEMVTKWLSDNMLKGSSAEDISKIIDYLSSHASTKAHNRHIEMNECKELGLHIIPIEDYNKENDFQDLILTIHHTYMHTFASSNAIKIVENHLGNSMIYHIKLNPTK